MKVKLFDGPVHTEDAIFKVAMRDGQIHVTLVDEMGKHIPGGNIFSIQMGDGGAFLQLYSCIPPEYIDIQSGHMRVAKS